MKSKRFLALFLSVLMVGMLTACGTSSSSSSSEGKVDAPSTASGAEATRLVFWHGMSGINGEIMKHIVDTFNSSQSKVFVEEQYQGTYEESINKLKTAMRTKDGPDLVQIYEAGTRFMVDSPFIYPMQNIVDEYSIDISKLEEHILDYYTINDKLYSMPLNTSLPVCFYNKTMLAKIGYEDGPKTWDDIIDISTKVQAQGLAESGLANANFIWWFEQPMVQQHYAMVDNDNGRSAPATRSTLTDGDLPLKIAKKWLDMFNNGHISKVGFSVNDNRTNFWSGLSPVSIDSSGALRTYLETIDGTFELGVGYFPAMDAASPNGGVTLGGASIYVCDNGRGTSINAAIAEFIKYVISPEMQAYFHINSGYFPITTEAYERDDVKENLKKYPQFQSIVDQLRFSKNMGFGAIYGTLVEGRSVYQNYLEQMLLGKLSPEDCINKSAADIDNLIKEYNLANQ